MAKGVGRRLAAAAFLLVGMALLGGASAAAAPAIPGIPDCKDAPVAQSPGDGLSGFLDPPPQTLPAAGDPFAATRTTSVYDQYGYAGLRWATYDLGCGGSVRDMGATTDTMLGNAFLSVATWGTAATNGLHNWISHPERYMAPLDDIVATTTDRVHDAIWTPWGGAALTGVVVLLLLYSTAGRLPDVAKAGAWALLVLTVMAGLAQYPSRVSSFFDSTVIGAIGAVNSASAGLSSLPPTADPARAQGALLVDRVLYDSWLRGQLGSTDSEAARRFGPDLFRASAYTWQEAEQAKDPAKARQLAEAKAQAWKDVAQKVQDQDPSAYAALQGKAGDRAGVGLMTMLGATFTGLFRVIADLFTFAGLAMLRLLVMFFPAVAVIGVLAPMASLVRRVANIAGAAVVNVIAFAAGSAVHTTVVSATLSRADSAGMNVLALVLCGVVTLAAFVLLYPLLSLTNIVGVGTSGRGGHVLGSAARAATRYAVTRRAVQDGASDAMDDAGQSAHRVAGAGAAGGGRGAGPGGYGRPGQRSAGRGTVPPEGFARGEAGVYPGGYLTVESSGSRPAQRALLDGPGDPMPVLPAGPAPMPALSSGASAFPAIAQHRESTPEELHFSRRDGAYQVRQPFSPRHWESPDRTVLEGVVVSSVPASVSASPADVGPTRMHDSQTVIGSDGVGPRLYDPATKRSRRVDDEGNVMAGVPV